MDIKEDPRPGKFDEVGLTSNIVNKIMQFLFAKEFNRLHQFIVNTSKLNDEAYGEYKEGFMFNGDIFKIDNSMIVKIDRPLHESLSGKMLDFIKDREKIKQDFDAVRMMLVKLVGPCRSCDEVRDNLPNCLEDCIQMDYLQPRANHPGYLLPDDRSKKQFEKVIPLIEFYSAARLIY